MIPVEICCEEDYLVSKSVADISDRLGDVTFHFILVE
jgi:hypothetical protein